MPELPEVETIRRGLAPRIVGWQVSHLLTGDDRVFQSKPRLFSERLPGQSIRALTRRGKFLIVELGLDWCIFHLGMTGQLTVRDPEQQDASGFLRHEKTGLQRTRQHAPDRHTHLQIIFSNEKALLYRDIRKFGRIFLLRKESESLEEFFASLGLEPFSSEYTLERFLAGFTGRKAPVKALLLNQRLVAGLGNIYADETLFEAGIHPLRRGDTLSRREKIRLFETIPRVLEKGIHFGGTTLRDYVNSDGDAGSFQEELLVYGRAGEDCHRCGHAIQKMVVAQRGTHLCPRCQPTCAG